MVMTARSVRPAAVPLAVTREARQCHGPPSFCGDVNGLTAEVRQAAAMSEPHREQSSCGRGTARPLCLPGRRRGTLAPPAGGPGIDRPGAAGPPTADVHRSPVRLRAGQLAAHPPLQNGEHAEQQAHRRKDQHQDQHLTCQAHASPPAQIPRPSPSLEHSQVMPGRAKRPLSTRRSGAPPRLRG
jgi:hypothetical protein